MLLLNLFQMPITFGKTNLDNSLLPSLALFGLMKSPLWLNTLSTEAEVAGTQRTFSSRGIIGANHWSKKSLTVSSVVIFLGKKRLVSGHCLVKWLLGFKFHQKHWLIDWLFIHQTIYTQHYNTINYITVNTQYGMEGYLRNQKAIEQAT